MAYLDQACAANPALRASVEALLRANVGATGFLERSAPAATIDQPPSEQAGSLIGPYKLLEQIGEGGMGLVYMAEQQQPVRRLVALKLVKPGMDTKQVIARFEAERQALAMMDHPNIAKVHDAGTTETGRPYFAMELVRGIPINEFCDQPKLTVRQRLELFIPVCQAVQHAHQKGIIHRDLKPTNVLVTNADIVPLPKVIDFGIAKALGPALTDHTLHTGFAQLVGTPMYMSPEQAQMNHFGVDTRSDVYSLGVMLYELLTGTTPFDKERLKSVGFDEMRRIIREEEPETVSTRLAKTKSRVGSAHQADVHPSSFRLHPFAELDWIVMKALEKDRSRRYESASALATDIQRYLSDEPVLACPPTTMYRFQKFARKHRPALFAAAAIALCLLLGTTVSAWQAVRATTAESQANANEQKAVANEQKANANAAQAQEKAKEATEQRDEAQKQRDEVRALYDKLQRTSYAANMTLAKHAWDEAAVSRAVELLNQHVPKAGETDLRGFEWHYLQRLCHAELLILKAHTRSASVSFSPDGKRLASAGEGDKVLKVWDAATGKQLLSIADGGWEVVFSPDGNRLASAASDKTVKVWNAQTGQQLLTLKGHTNHVSGVAFSADGKRIAAGSAQWTETPKPGEVRVWDAQTGEELVTFKGHAGDIFSLAFSPDGKRLASADWGNTIKLWDAESGQELFSFKSAGNEVAFSPDGKRLASGVSNGTVKLWDSETGRELRTLKGHAGMQVHCVVFSPDGKRLASAGADRTAKIWNVETGQELIAFKGHPNMVQSVAFSPDGTRLASGGGEGTVRIWNATENRGMPNISGANGSVTSMAFSSDGKRYAAAIGSGNWDNAKQTYPDVAVIVCDSQTGKELVRIKGQQSHLIRNVAFSADGKRVISTLDEKTLKVWDSENGQELLTFSEHTKGLTSLAVSSDGKHVASADAGALKVWDAASGQVLFTFKGTGNVAFSPDGARLASSGGTATVWDVRTGEELHRFGGYAGCVAFSPDGRWLASAKNLGRGPGGTGEVVVWDIQTGKQLFNLKGHTTDVRSVSFSPDGRRLASGSGSPFGGEPGEVKLWDLQSGHELLNLKQTRVRRVNFNPSGHWLVVNAGTRVSIYDATPLPEKP
jgi:WD40 repeat protein/serine/threonine protein kinase